MWMGCYLDELNSNRNYVCYEPWPNKVCCALGVITRKLKLTLPCVVKITDKVYITIQTLIKVTDMHDSGYVDSSHVLPKKYCYPFDKNNYHRLCFGTPYALIIWFQSLTLAICGRFLHYLQWMSREPLTGLWHWCPKWKERGYDRLHYFYDDCFQECQRVVFF